MRTVVVCALLIVTVASASAGPRWQTPRPLIVAGCGMPKMPPYGCTTGACVCDQEGRNCSWQIVCG